MGKEEEEYNFRYQPQKTMAIVQQNESQLSQPLLVKIMSMMMTMTFE